MKTVSKKLESWLKNYNEIIVPNLINSGFKPSPINAREGLANLTKSLVTDIPEVEQTFDEIIETSDYNVPIRIYNPAPSTALPVIVYYHGGGHMAGSVTVYDPICRKLAKITNHIVVSVEYRLAPENPYPAGIIDSYNAAKYVWKALDSRKMKYIKELSIAGDSGGAANAATVSMKSQFDRDLSIKNQILIYPSVDYTMESKSIEENGVGYLLGASKIKWYFDNYFSNNEDRKKASPLYGEFTVNIPRTLIFTAEFDPLRDEGYQYIEKLKKAGIDTVTYHLDGMIHPFLMMEDLVKEECVFVYEKINEFLKKINGGMV